jgi:hypothetical protein
MPLWAGLNVKQKSPFFQSKIILNLIDRPEHSCLQFQVSWVRAEGSRMGTQVDFLPWNRSLPFNPKRLPKQSCPISFPFST